MNIEQFGSFRTRTADDGSLEVWARGWRLESQLYALVPMGLALMFLLAPMALPMRVGGAAVMLASTLFVFKMTKPGLRFARDAVTIVGVVRTQRFPWDRVSGFMGERRHDEARILLILDDDRQVPLPGTLDPAELDPYGDEGQMLSAADQLNRLRELSVAGELPKPSLPVIAASSEGERSRDERRSERKAVRAALKALRAPGGVPVLASTPPDREAPTPPRRSLRRRSQEREPELVEVEISEPEPIAVTAPREEPAEEPTGLPSYFPKPTYIPQAEYAQMLREQKAAEKAAVEAAAELRRLAELEDLDELAKKEEFSDWTS